MSITLTVLGSGTCHPVRGGKRRHHPGFFVRWGEGDQHLLLEASGGIAERLEQIGERPDEIKHVAVSHAHPDHFCWPGFLQTCLCCGMRREEFDPKQPELFQKIQLYAPGHIVRSLEMLNRIHFEEGEEGKGLPFPLVHSVDMTAASRSGGVNIGDERTVLTATRAYHGFGRVDALAYRLQVHDKIIAYSGDSGVCGGLAEIARNADLFVCEASARIGDEESPHTYGHLNPYETGILGIQANVRHLALTHHSGVDSDEAMIADCRRSGYSGRLTIARDFQVFEL